jgi:hypothetical protein
MLRSLRLWHGVSVTPLLSALESERGPALDAALALVRELLQSAGESAFPPSLLQLGLDCRGCEAHPAHSPTVHLSESGVAAACSRAVSLLACSDWRAALQRLPPSEAVLYASLALATVAAASAAPADEAAASEVVSVDAFASEGQPSSALRLPPPDALAQEALLPFLSATGRFAEPDAPQSTPAWRRLPPWLASLAAAASPAFCDAYVAALAAPGYGGREKVRDAASILHARARAARLRGVCAAGATVHRAGTSFAEAIAPALHAGSKRPRDESSGD